MNNSCVYIHRRLDNGTPFYVGKGSIKRSSAKSERSVFWNRVSEKYGFSVDIIADGLSERDAYDMEVSLISFYGRIDNGTGILVNHTDGGEGSKGYQHTDDAKLKISEASKKIPKETRMRVASARIGIKDSLNTKHNKSVAAIGNTKGQNKKPSAGMFKGVSFHKPTGKWMAKITVNYKQKYLGLYVSDVDAAKAYDAVAFDNWGSNCYINFPDNCVSL